MSGWDAEPMDSAALALIQAFGAGLPYHSFGVDECRAMIAANAAGQPVTVGGVSTRDLRIPGAVGPIKARVYRPDEPAADRPLIVYFHGGGWALGSIESSDGLCCRLAAGSGSVVASVDYRLAPEHPFPAGLDDCIAAATHLARTATEIGASPGPVVLAGDSAGANLAAAAALAARGSDDLRIALQVLCYGVFDCDFERESMRQFNSGPLLLTTDDMRWFWDLYAAEPLDDRAAPLRAQRLDGLPPAIVQIAGHDPLRDEGAAFAARLRDDGTQVVELREPSLPHGLLSLADFVPAAGAAFDRLVAEIRIATG